MKTGVSELFRPRCRRNSAVPPYSVNSRCPGLLEFVGTRTARHEAGSRSRFSTVVVSVDELRTSRGGRCTLEFQRAAWDTSPTKKGSTKMKTIIAMKKEIVLVLILMGLCVPNAFAGTWTVSLYVTGLELIQPALRKFHNDGPFEQPMQHMSPVRAKARNPRPYTGPTAVVAPGGTCPNGLAPNPFTNVC